VRSTLGQSLDADIPIVALAAREVDSLLVRMAPIAAYGEAGIDYTPLLRSVRIVVEKRGDQHVVRVTSDLPVNDPFVRLLVELNANGSRMIREYALLIDPPTVVPAPAVGHVNRSESETARTAPPAPATPREAMTTPEPATAAAPSAIADRKDRPTDAAREAGAATRIVRRGDTLRSIGTAIQPQGVRLEQVLVATQNANPDAFIDRNINRLRKGSVLRVPTEEAMRAVDPESAKASLRRQGEAFAKYQRSLVPRVEKSAVQATEPAVQPGNRQSSGQVGKATDMGPASATQQDRLTLSTPGTSEPAGNKASPADALDKIASDKALADANSRVAALEKNISQLQQLLEVRNGELATAEQRARQSRPASPAAKAGSPEPAVSGQLPTQAQPPSPSSMSSPSTTAPSAMAPSATVPSTASGSPASSKAESPADAAVPPQTESSEKRPSVSSPRAHSTTMPSAAQEDASLWAMLSDPRSVAGIVALILLPLTWIALRWRRSRKTVEEAVVEPMLAAQTVVAGAGGRHVDTRHSEFHSNFVPSVSQIDANEVDALAEADVYIAYGRDEQAEEILLDALRIHPQRDALRVKLLEIYAARQDRQKFGALAAELRVRTHGTGADWEAAARLGRQLDPGNRIRRTGRLVAPACGGSDHLLCSQPVSLRIITCRRFRLTSRRHDGRAPACGDGQWGGGNSVLGAGVEQHRLSLGRD